MLVFLSRPTPSRLCSVKQNHDMVEMQAVFQAWKCQCGMFFETLANRLPTEVFIKSARCQRCPSQNCASDGECTISVVQPYTFSCADYYTEQANAFPLPAALVRDCTMLNVLYGRLLEVYYRQKNKLIRELSLCSTNVFTLTVERNSISKIMVLEVTDRWQRCLLMPF